jgi:hypothetical protein
VKQREWKKSRYDRGGTHNRTPRVAPWAIFCRPDRVGALDIQFNVNCRSGIIRLGHASSRSACDKDSGMPREDGPPGPMSAHAQSPARSIGDAFTPRATLGRDTEITLSSGRWTSNRSIGDGECLQRTKGPCFGGMPSKRRFTPSISVSRQDGRDNPPFIRRHLFRRCVAWISSNGQDCLQKDTW